jgi:hypothetical protein
MPYKITFDLPNLSKGQGVAINGLGEFKNGRTYTITDDQHDQFRAFNVVQVDDEETGQVVNKPGPTLLKALFQEGITVEKVTEEKASGPDSEEPQAAPPEKSVEGVDNPNAKPAKTVQKDAGPTKKGSDK